MTSGSKKLLILITLLALALRLYRPNYPSLLWDEAALGYNSYSLLKTARDEYGTLLPLIFKSFGDYKPGLYVYLTLPFVATLGLTHLAVRLPSIILGSLLPYFLYLLITQISPKSKKLALLSAVILAFNPINIHFSRGAWETNILTVELVPAALFFYRKKYTISALIFATTLYTYQGAKLTSLLLIFILTLIHLKKITHKPSVFALKFILPLFILALPLAYGLFFNTDSNRLKIVSLFSYPRSQTETDLIISESSLLNYQVFYNRPIFFFRNFISRYFNHFSPQLLAFVGDWQNPRHSAPHVGILLFPSLIFFVIGLFSLPAKTAKLRAGHSFFLFWLLVAPIPAALTRDSVQTVRAMSFSIPLVFFTALGLHTFLKKYHHTIIRTSLIIIYLLSFIYYSDLYHNHMIKKSPHHFLYGYQQASQYLIQNQSQYQNIYFTNFYGQPYIYYLFYSQYSPAKYQDQAQLTENQQGDTGTVDRIDNIRFTSTPTPLSLPPNSLAIYSHDELLRLNLDPKMFIPLSPVNNISTFYAYHN